MTDKKRKILYVLLKSASVLIACGLPIYAVCEHFPLWAVTHGSTKAVGAGGIISLCILVTVFRKSVFPFLIDRFHLRHAPPVTVWLVLLAVTYALLYIHPFLCDLTTVLWFGLVGCALGTAMTFAAETLFAKRKEDGNGGS